MFFKKATSGQMTASQYAITIIAVIIGYIVLGQIPLTLVLLNKIQNDSSIGMDALDKFQSQPDFSIFGMDKNIGLFLMLCIFIFGMLALWLGVKYAHKMAFKRLITPYENINWGKILFAFGFWFILALLIEGGFYFLNPAVYSFHFDLGKFIPLLLLAIFVLPIQTSFEELFFRGYLMPGMGLLTKNKWLPLIITSVLFGLIHGFNPEVEKYGFFTMQFYYISAGLFLGLITILDDSLELALGVHAATNIFGVLILTFDGGVLQTDSLFRASEMNPVMAIVAFYIASGIFAFICWKKYGWKSETLTDEIEFEIKEENI